MENFAIFANQAAFDAFLTATNSLLGYPLPDGTAVYTQAIQNEAAGDDRVAALVDSSIDQTTLTIQSRDYLLDNGWFAEEAQEALREEVQQAQQFGLELIVEFSAETQYLKIDDNPADLVALAGLILPVQNALISGSIKTAKIAMEAVVAQPFLTQARIDKYIQLMDDYLNPA